MVYWRGQPLDNLPRTELERAANEAIAELMGMRDDHTRRESYDSIIVSFLFGAMFCAAAVLVGFLLH